MEEYINRDTNTTDKLKHSIASAKNITASDITILNINEDKDGEYGLVNVKYLYNNAEHTISVLRAFLGTISIYAPPGGKLYNNSDSIFHDIDINNWSKEKYLKFVCDQLDIPYTEVHIDDIYVGFGFDNEFSVNADIVANENSAYVCGRVRVSAIYSIPNYIDTDVENIKSLLPKTFRHDYIEEYIKLYDDYTEDIPTEKLLELENKKIQEAGRDAFFVKVPGYTYDPRNKNSKDDERILIGGIFEKSLLGTITSKDVYYVDDKYLGWSSGASSNYAMLSGLRIDNGTENVFKLFYTRRFSLIDDLVPVVPKRGYTRNHTTNISTYVSNKNKNVDYYVDSIKHINGSAFRLRSDPSMGRLVYYSGVKKKDSYTDDEFEELKNSIKAGIENQLYNVYNLPRSTVNLNIHDFRVRSLDTIDIYIYRDSMILLPGRVTIKIVYEK